MTVLEDGIRLVRHPRARRLRLRLDPASGQAVLTLPRGASRAEATAFLLANQGWLTSQRRRLAPGLSLVPGTRLSLFGQEVTLVHAPGQRGPAELAGSELRIGGLETGFTRRALRGIRALALSRFILWAGEFGAQLGLPAAPVRVGDTRSRWGSCSAQGHISLSWRLALAPVGVARYVVAHEVAHRREMNHGPAFWALVNQLVGEVRLHRGWLKNHGPALLRIGVAPVPPGPA